MSNLCISMKTPNRDLDKSPVDRAITALAASIATERRNGTLPVGPALDMTFMLSSGDDKPPFDGMRMGGYSAENRTLFFEAAVSESMAYSAQAPRYVAALLQDMIDNAALYFSETKVPFDADSWQAALAPLLTAVTHPETLH